MKKVLIFFSIPLLLISCGYNCLECKCDKGWQTKDGMTSRGKDFKSCVGDESYHPDTGITEKTKDQLEEMYEKYKTDCSCFWVN